MGGGSSVMGMVALSRHARRLRRMGGARRRRLGLERRAAVLSASSRTIWISAASCTARTARCRSAAPARRTGRRCRRRVHAYAQERQIPFIADMNADFRDGYGAVPMSNWPDKRASAAICYLDAAVRARGNLTIINGATATGLVFDGRRVTGVIARVGGEDEAVRRARDHPVARRHPFAGLPDARGHRPGRASARASASTCAPTCRASARTCPTTPSCSSACCRSRDARQAAVAAAASDDGVPLFLRACRARRHRHVHQRAVQDLVERARPRRSPTWRPRCSSRWRAAASRWTGPTRSAAAGRVQLHRPRARPASGSCRASAARSRSWRTRRCAR